MVPCDSMAWPDRENGVQRLSENAFQRGDYLSKNMQVVVANKFSRMPSPSPIGDDLFGPADRSSK